MFGYLFAFSLKSFDFLYSMWKNLQNLLISFSRNVYIALIGELKVSNLFLFNYFALMQNYELVLLLNANTSEADRKAFLADLEAKFEVKEKDEIWIQNLSFKLKDKNTKAYFVSYLLNLSPEQVKEVKAALLYNQAVVKYEIYKMGKEQTFFHFEKLQSEFDKAIEEIKDRKYGQKITFFANERNAKYINWKSLPILKYYLTRFGDIKPRLYTGNSVKIQKKVRQEIIRARTLGLLNFISR